MYRGSVLHGLPRGLGVIRTVYHSKPHPQCRLHLVEGYRKSRVSRYLSTEPESVLSMNRVKGVLTASLCTAAVCCMVCHGVWVSYGLCITLNLTHSVACIL